jgi:hypothetical protein
MALLLGNLAYAGFNQFSIGMKLGSDNTRTGNSTLNPTDTAGLPAVSQINWNNLPGISGAATLTDNAGNTTSAGVAWSTPTGTWSSGANSAFPAGPDQVLMNGYLDNGGTATVTITNLPSQLTTKGYDVYVYALFDTPNRGGTYSIVDGLNPSTVLTKVVGLNSDSTPTNYVQDALTTANDTGNYIVFHGLTNANIQLVAVATNTGTARAVICGMQLVAAPAPGEAGSATGATAAPNATSGQLVVSWNNGVSAQGALVVMRKGLPVTAKPVDGVVYTASQSFGLGTNLGDDEFGAGNYAVFNGATSGGSTSVTVSNLIPNTTYYVAVYSSTGSGASIDYTLAAPSTTNGVPAGNLTSLTLNLPSPVIIGSARHFSVSANYDNGTSSDVTGLATVTSTNTSIVTIISAGRLGAITNGTVWLRAVYSGNTNYAPVTVSGMSMTYRFSFNDPPGSLTVTDSVAGAVGVISNSPSTGPDGNGNLVFDGAGGYVALPPNILTNYGGVTMEFWATLAATSTWERFWDFGSGQTVNMFMTPVAGGAVLRTAFTVGGGGAETRVDYGYSADFGLHQFVFTLAGATRTAKLYLDGVQVSSVSTFTLTPEDEGPTPNNYLGKSQYPDPYLTGSMADFRIYNGPLDPLSIAIDAATGPDVITNNPGAISSLIINAGSPIVQFGTEQVAVTGTFANIANPVNLASAPQTKYFTSDSHILVVDPVGVLTATGPGTGTLTVTSFGLTGSVQVVVTALPPGMTHRWSFNTDFNDSVNPATPAFPHNSVSLDGNGNAVLDGAGAANTTSGSYIELPGNVLLGYTSIGLECWYTDECGDGTVVNRNWARLFDFGSGAGNNLFATPFVAGIVDTFRFSLNTNNAGEWQVHIARPITNVEHHLVFNINATNHTATAYIDGEFAGQNQNFAVLPRDLGQNPNDWLGRSQYGDPLFQGLIDEFRIYNGTVDPVQVGIDFATGPNTIVNNPGAPTAVNVVLTTNILVGQTINAQCLANYASVTGAHVTSAGPTWVSSDPTVARVDQFGRLTAVGVGSATISATFSNLTGVATVSVAAQPPVLTHRYSFDSGDATDSVGGANGTATGTPVFTNGMLTIADSSSWIQLPGHLFDTNLEVTLEFWAVIFSSNGSGARMADFGTSADSNPNAFGRSAFGLAPTANGNNLISFRPSPGDQIGTPAIDSYGRPAFGTTNHYAYVISDIDRRIDFYLNGALKDSFHYSSQPDEEIGGVVQLRTVLGYQFTNQTEGWFGKNVGSGLSGAVGSAFRGSIDEFRIWAGAMDQLQAEVSYQKGPENPQVNAGALQTLSVNINDPTMILGAVQKPSVSGTFANTSGQIDLTGYSPVTFTSDNSGVVSVVNGGNTKLKAVGVGSAHVVASYLGLKVTNSITVIAKPLAQLTHRYSFRGNANDSVGQANARLLGNAAIVGGRVVLDGSLNPSSYVLLPSDLISGYDLLTFEAFYAVPASASGTQQRLWDFGNHTIASGGVEGSGYFYEAAGRGAVGMPNNLGSRSEATAAIPPTVDQAGYTTNTTCVAVTVDSINHILSLYTNGVFCASVTNTAVDLSLVNDNFSQLGRSQWADPMYNGSIDEFRIYYGTLTAGQISDSFAGGPDPETLKTVVGPAAGQVTVSWPATLVTAGYQLQVNSSLNSATWGPGGSPTVVNGRNQVIVNSGSTPSFFRLKK